MWGPSKKGGASRVPKKGDPREGRGTKTRKGKD